MIKLPAVVGLTLCDRVAVDPVMRQYSLIGIFHSLRFSSFPSPPRKFIVYAALYDGFGEGTIEVEMVRIETEEVIYTYRRWLRFAHRLMLVNLEIPVSKCIFPAPGRFFLFLRFDNQEISQRFLEISF